MQKQFLLLIVALFFSIFGIAQTNKPAEDAAYQKMIQGRAWKIVQKLEIKDTVKAIKVRDLIAEQYSGLNDIYQVRDHKIKDFKNNTVLAKEAKQDSIKAVQLLADAAVEKRHQPYLKKLSHLLKRDQVLAVKNGMTYGVLPLTYNAYMDMLPQLTGKQKKQIMIWLTEAREKAMDAESSDKKHAWFGKYKGKINNYLSADGIDMKKEGDAWQERIKARSAHH